MFNIPTFLQLQNAATLRSLLYFDGIASIIWTGFVVRISVIDPKCLSVSLIKESQEWCKLSGNIRFLIVKIVWGFSGGIQKHVF